MVTGAACVYSRFLIPHFFHLLDTPMVRGCMKEMERMGVLPSLADDIILSYAAMNLVDCRKKNRCYGYKVQALNDAEGLCENPAHYEARTKMMQVCREYLCLPLPKLQEIR
jgi:hypothetical protein